MNYWVITHVLLLVAEISFLRVMLVSSSIVYVEYNCMQTDAACEMGWLYVYVHFVVI